MSKINPCIGASSHVWRVHGACLLKNCVSLQAGCLLQVDRVEAIISLQIVGPNLQLYRSIVQWSSVVHVKKHKYLVYFIYCFHENFAQFIHGDHMKICRSKKEKTKRPARDLDF
jgi:hypothetical protein